MGVTKQIPRAEWQSYFARFTRKQLLDERGTRKSIAIEVLSPALGDQFEATLVPIEGITYEPKSEALELALENLDHIVLHPAEIWVMEDERGFIPALEIVRADGTKEIIHLVESGTPSQLYGTPSQPQG